MRISKNKVHFLFLSFVCWRNRNRKKKTKKMEKAKKNPKNRFFEGGHPKLRKIKKWIFSKH